MRDVFRQLQGATAATLRVASAEVKESATDEDIAAWDSLGHVNLMMTLEQTFGVVLDVEDFGKLTSVPTILGYLKDRRID
jgi:acyl carrier protein